MSKKVALVMTYAHPEEENRLKTQVAELLRTGFEVHTLGFGRAKLLGVESHFEIPKRQDIIGLARVALIHIFLPVKSRFQALRVPSKVSRELDSLSLDLIITHDLELLPLLFDQDVRPKSFDRAVKQIDLHELHEFRSTVSGAFANFIWRVLAYRLKSYHDWLMSLLRSDEVKLATVVNQSIGNWYVQNGYLREFTEVLNAAPYLEAAFERRRRDELKFVYHGRYSWNRGQGLLVTASLGIKATDSLHLMLTGDESELKRFKSYALSKNPKIVFHNPVPMADVSKELSQFDVEIIFTEPVFKNREFTMPNKFFEAIQGRLAVVCGPSPELVRFTNQFGNGQSTSGWDVKELSELLANLDRPSVEIMRLASHNAARRINAETESRKLSLAWTRELTSLESKELSESPEELN